MGCAGRLGPPPRPAGTRFSRQKQGALRHPQPSNSTTDFEERVQSESTHGVMPKSTRRPVQYWEEIDQVSNEKGRRSAALEQLCLAELRIPLRLLVRVCQTAPGTTAPCASCSSARADEDPASPDSSPTGPPAAADPGAR